MKSTSLSHALRRIVAFSLAIAPGAAACRAGSAATSALDLVDASTAGASWSCGAQTCSGDCDAGTIPVATCTSGTLRCTCAPPPPAAPLADGGGVPDGATDSRARDGASAVADAEARADASLDGGSGADAALDPCEHATVCQKFYRPLYCSADASRAGTGAIDATPGDASPGGGTVYTTAECTLFCGAIMASCAPATVGTDTPAVVCFPSCLPVGRQPAGLAPRAPCRDGSELGRYLAGTAALEAAAVGAFRQLEAELARHGAPRRLRRQAARAAEDEVRHARAMGALARREGARVEGPARPPAELRPLEVMATENAVEGCVRETMGALIATAQATASRDPRVREAMRRIARDEQRHAALAWRVAAWADTKLDAGARGRVAAARRRAALGLRAELSTPWPASLRAAAGLPEPDELLRMAEGVLRLSA